MWTCAKTFLILMLKIGPIAFVSTYCNCQFSKMVEDFSVKNPDTYKFKCYLEGFNPIASSQLTTSASLPSCVVGSNSLRAKSSLYSINGCHVGRAGGNGGSRAKEPLPHPTQFLEMREAKSSSSNNHIHTITTLVYQIEVQAGLLILKRNSNLHGLILVCMFINFGEISPLHIYDLKKTPIIL